MSWLVSWGALPQWICMSSHHSLCFKYLTFCRSYLSKAEQTPPPHQVEILGGMLAWKARGRSGPGPWRQSLGRVSLPVGCKAPAPGWRR